MSSDQPYTPSEAEMVEGERRLPSGVYKPLEEDEYARGIAQVRRDAAREALDGYVAWAKSLNDKHPRFRAANGLAAAMAERFKTDNYPEETP